MDTLDENRQHKKEDNVKQKAFLAALSECGNITKAADVSGVARASHYVWLEDEEYKNKYKLAMEEAFDRLEYEARRRAMQGVQDPVFYQGIECGTITKYSDTLLMFLLKGANPEKYAERVKSENKNQNDNSNTNKNIDLSHLTVEQIKELLGDGD